MSEPSQQQPRKLTKCQRCRKVIDTNLLDEHDKKWCKFKSKDKVCNSVKKAPSASRLLVQISDGRDREFFDDHGKKMAKHNSQNQLSANIGMSQPSKTCDLRKAAIFRGKNVSISTKVVICDDFRPKIQFL